MKSFLNLFLRVIWQNRTFSLLNITGLAVGMASFILIVIWIADELSYDRYNVDADRIVRVVSHFKMNGNEGTAIYCPAPLAGALQRDFPEVENTVRFRSYGSFIIQRNDIVFDENRVIFADSTFFSFFTVPMLKGNPDKVLVPRRSLAISASAAKRYFGDEDPVGQVLRLDNRTDYVVNGVFEDMPSASHFHFDFIASLHTYNEANEDMWLSNNYLTYVKLQPNTDISAFRDKMGTVILKYLSVQAEMALGLSWDKIVESGTEIGYSLQKLTDIHLKSNVDGELETPGNMAMVKIFAMIALFIILIACINFTNLSTARSFTRLKEVGVRKTFGVGRRQLVLQFIAESLVIVFIAHVFALIMVEISLPFFNDLTGKSLGLSYFSGKYILSVLAMIIVISLLAGSYPSFYLSSYRPIMMLRGELGGKKGQVGFRSILVIIQFFISLVLLCSSLVIIRQMKYIQTKDLGFDNEQLIVLNNTYMAGDNLLPLKEQISQNPSVVNATVSGYLPIPSNRNNSSVFPDAIITENLFNCQNWRVDLDYIKTMGLQIVKGRDFSIDFPTDSLALIINETAARGLGWDDPIGKIIGVPDDYNDIKDMALDKYTIVGVVKDFHFESMHTPIEPMIIFLGRSNSRITVRVNANTDIQRFLKSMGDIWNQFVPGQPFSYSFVDDRLASLYESEQKLITILGLFTLFAFFVSSLGLIGLSIFASGQRRREIGLRKVNGSGVVQIVWLLSTDFTKLIAVSFVLSVPVTVIFMNRWLAGFAYRTGIAWWIFIVTGMLTYLVAMVAIIFQSYRAATTNPVDVFRTE